MKQVIDKYYANDVVYYKFTKSLFHKVVLWIGREVQEWDTNTGQNSCPVYIQWKTANLSEARRLLTKCH